MKLSIARALKEKNRLITEMNRLFKIIDDKNCRDYTFSKNTDGTFFSNEDYEASIEKSRQYDLNELMSDYMNQRNKLIQLKSLITKANADIAEKLVTMSETKSYLSLLNDKLSVGDNRNSDGISSVRLIRYKFDSKWKDTEVKKCTDLINTLQDEIDEYNATHYIEFDI